MTEQVPVWIWPRVLGIDEAIQKAVERINDRHLQEAADEREAAKMQAAED